MMTGSQFVYVTFIRTTPEKLWDALLKPEFTRIYWLGVTLEGDWKRSTAWKMKYPDGRITDSGEVLEVDPPRRLVLKWRNEFRPELHAEGYSRCAFDIEEQGEVVKLTIRHTIDRENSKLIEAVSGGWPMILSSLKTFLESGKPLAVVRVQKTEGAAK